MRFKRSGVIGAFATACIIAGTFATYSIRAQPSGGGDASLGFNCPLSTSASAQNSLCVTVSIPQGAAGLGKAAFGVNPLSVGLGATVIWWNQDSVSHTVTADDGSFDSGPIAPGQYFAHTFNTSGTKTYYCKIHGRQAMSGAVTVGSAQANPVGCSTAVIPPVTPTLSPIPAPTLLPPGPADECAGQPDGTSCGAGCIQTESCTCGSTVCREGYQCKNQQCSHFTKGYECNINTVNDCTGQRDGRACCLDIGVTGTCSSESCQ